MAKVEQPLFILPKKRNGKKPNAIAGHVDHIITVQVSPDNNIVLNCTRLFYFKFARLVLCT